MNRFLLSVILLTPCAALAGSAFDSTWKARLNTIKVSGKPDVWAIVEGTYSCASCSPPVNGVPADGAWHKISGHAYYDELMIKVVDARTVEVSQKQRGKLTGISTQTVSADGNSIAGKFTGYTGTQPVTGTFTEKRVAAAPAGAHAASGSWLQDQMSSANDALSVVAYSMGADDFSMKSNGQSYRARFDGKEYPVKGDPGGTRVKLKRVDERNVVETDYRQGKAVDEIHLAMAPDSRTLELTDKDIAHDQTTTMTLDRQP